MIDTIKLRDTAFFDVLLINNMFKKLKSHLFYFKELYDFFSVYTSNQYHIVLSSSFYSVSMNTVCKKVEPEVIQKL